MIRAMAGRCGLKAKGTCVLFPDRPALLSAIVSPEKGLRGIVKIG